MPKDQQEIERRKALTVAAMSLAFENETEEDEEVTLFISHHLEEVGKEYWDKYFPKGLPEPISVLGMLVFKSHWGGENEMDNFDYTLPDADETTNYVISASFNDKGEVDYLSMESS